MIQLGISAFYHDSAACIVQNGKVLVAVEEERFTEVKHDSSFPVNSIKWVLEYCGLTIKNVDQVCWYENPKIKKDRILETLKVRDFNIKDPKIELEKLGYMGDIIYTPHHLSHAAFSYYTSPYKKSAILSVDGVGEWDTVSIWEARGKDIKYLYGIQFPNSLGLLYSTITAFLGFKPNEGEYKVMGLAPYGDPEVYFKKLGRVFLSKSRLELDTKYFNWEKEDTVIFNIELAYLLDLLPRLPKEEITQSHKDLAAALQKIYEREFLKLVKKTKLLTGLDNLCLSGGCAYNGVANNKAYRYFKSIHIPYAPSDAGSAIGACLYNYKGKRKNNSSPFLGPEFNDKEIEKELKKYKLSYRHLGEKEICKQTARLIKKGKIIAWFQGRMEFGARALGNRSILANPTIPNMREKLNLVIKKREGFRPFAPSVLKKYQDKYFEVIEDIPYMNQVVKAKSNNFPSAIHVDNTSRVHTVVKKENPVYYLLLKYIEKETGYPVVLNTSFNLKDQTITMTPKQAVERYLSSDIDYLVINNFIITK